MELNPSYRKTKIPAHARKVFSGVLFDVYQWEQELFDGSFATFEMLKRRDGAFIIPILENGKILIAEDEQPGREMKITFPGGEVEDGETPLEAVKREFLEETGYEAEEIEIHTTISPVSKLDWTVYSFIGRNCKKITEPKEDPGERIQVREITLDELIALAEHPSFHGTSIAMDLVKAKYDPEARALLEKTLFG